MLFEAIVSNNLKESPRENEYAHVLLRSRRIQVQ